VATLCFDEIKVAYFRHPKGNYKNNHAFKFLEQISTGVMRGDLDF
jgi:hypothetical protein